MKKPLLLVLIIFCCFATFSQNKRKIDSLQRLLILTEIDTNKVDLYIKLAIEYELKNNDTTFYFAQQAYKISKKEQYLSGISRSVNIIGNVYLSAGNYSKALEYYLIKLKIEEQGNKPEALAIANMAIANVHHLEGNNDKAFPYAFCADSLIDKYKISRLKIYSLLNLGDMYEKSDKILSALDYTEKAYALATKENNINFKGATLNNLGNIYAKMGNSELSIKNYTAAIPFLTATNDDGFLAESSLGLATQYLNLSNKDSALYYALISHELSKKNGFLSKQLKVSIFLADFYIASNNITKAFEFKEEVLILKDSIFSKERIEKSQLISMEEDLRQKEIIELKLEEAKERRVKIQYLSISLMLPILLFFTLYLNNRKIKPKYVEFLGVVSLLLMFEFIMLVLHPIIIHLTNHTPLLDLTIFGVIASILTPLHHRIESWLLRVLSSKEKVSIMKIRID